LGSFPRSTCSHDCGLKPYPWMCCSSHGDSDRKLLLIEHRSEKTSQISTLPDFQTNHRCKSRGAGITTPTAEAHGRSQEPKNQNPRYSQLIGGRRCPEGSSSSSRKRLEFWCLLQPQPDHPLILDDGSRNKSGEGRPKGPRNCAENGPAGPNLGWEKKCSLGCARPRRRARRGRIRRIKPRTEKWLAGGRSCARGARR
jgi:hypothetical protein